MKSGRWLLGSAGLLLLALVPAMNSKAFSSVQPQSNTGCYTLSSMALKDLNDAQKQQVSQCDAQEAERGWQEQYGGMQNQQASLGVVYEPSPSSKATDRM